MNWTLAKETGLFLLSIYGAGLSTFNLLQGIHREKRAVRIRLNTAFLTYPNGQVSRPHLQIRVTNVGHRDVTITVIALELPDGGRIFSTSASLPAGFNTTLPIKLTDGQTAQQFFAYFGIGANTQHIPFGEYLVLTPICENSVGDIYRGDAWELDRQELQAIMQG